MNEPQWLHLFWVGKDEVSLCGEPNKTPFLDGRLPLKYCPDCRRIFREARYRSEEKHE